MQTKNRRVKFLFLGGTVYFITAFAGIVFGQNVTNQLPEEEVFDDSGNIQPTIQDKAPLAGPAKVTPSVAKDDVDKVKNQATVVSPAESDSKLEAKKQETQPEPKKQETQPEPKKQETQPEPKKQEAQPEPKKQEAQPESASKPLLKKTIPPVGMGSSNTFGAFRTGLGGGRPTFSKDLKFYEAMYGKTSGTMDFSATYYLTKKYLGIGLGFETGYYRDTGFPSRTRHPIADGDLSENEIDRGSKIQLTLIPIKIPLSLLVAPLPFADWLQISVWGGVERLYVQEIRVTSSYSSTEAGTQKYMNSGWNSGVFYGGGIPLKLDALDSSSVHSMDFMGIRSVYLLPFFETSKTVKVKTAKFDRTEIGLMFLFESL